MAQRVELLKGALEVRDATTKNGRPLSELDAFAKTIERARNRNRVKFDTKACPFQDVREGFPMNDIALRDIASRWEALTANISYLGHAFFDGNPPEVMTARQAHDLAFLGVILPAYFFNRAQDPIGRFGRLPDEVGDVHKSLKGLISPAAFVVTDHGDNAVIESGRQFYDVTIEKAAEGDNKFQLAGRVCPAPKELIAKFGEVFLLNTVVDFRQATLNGMIPDFAALKRFAELAAKYEAEYRHYEPSMRLLAKYWREAKTPPLIANYRGQFEEHRDHFVGVITPIQAEINTVLGHSPNLEVPPSPFDLERMFGLRS